MGVAGRSIRAVAHAGIRMHKMQNGVACGRVMDVSDDFPRGIVLYQAPG